jgi:hypothetical protein
LSEISVQSRHMEGWILERATRLAARTLRICGWLFAWAVLFLAVLATAYPLARSLRVERLLATFTMACAAMALLTMLLLWRMQRPNARWLLVAILLLASCLGGLVAFSAPASTRSAPDDWRAPSFNERPSRIRSAQKRDGCGEFRATQRLY